MKCFLVPRRLRMPALHCEFVFGEKMKGKHNKNQLDSTMEICPAHNLDGREKESKLVRGAAAFNAMASAF